MTTKEFIRRLAIFNLLDTAASKFELFKSDWIYKFDICKDNKHIVDFRATPYCPAVSDFDNVDYVFIEKFDRNAFQIQFSYFNGFYARLSENQKKSLIASGKVSFLLKLLNEGSK